MKKYKIIALFGKSASGKDTIQKWIVSNIPNTQGIISCTTRPKRDYETDGIDYHFLDNAEFGEKVLNGTMLEATSFRNWFYGTPIESLSQDKLNIGVFNIAGLNCLVADSRIELYPILVFADDKTRLLRSLNREQSPDCAEICRRFFTDESDFNPDRYEFNYQILNNQFEKIDTDKIIEIINNIAQNE